MITGACVRTASNGPRPRTKALPCQPFAPIRVQGTPLQPTPNGEVEGPDEASGRTQVERSSSGDLHSGRQAPRAHNVPSARGAKQEAPHGPLQRLLEVTGQLCASGPSVASPTKD